MKTTKNKIVYIGDFDMINNNVQSHLVRSNGRMLEELGYKVFYIGVNRKRTSFNSICDYEKGCYHVPNTLSIKGAFNYYKVKKCVFEIIDSLNVLDEIYAVISYQSPTFSIFLKDIVNWCRRNNVTYLVNSADIPVFESANILRNIIMKKNWNYLHRINKKYADGIIAVSRYIQDFYHKEGRPSIIIPPILDSDKQIIVKEKHSNTVNLVYAGTPFVVTNKKVPFKAMKDRLDVIILMIWRAVQKGCLVRLDIFGITESDYLLGVPEHKDIIHELNENVAFHGKIDHDSVLQYIANADATINFRDYSVMNVAGLSTKIIESISVGTPVIINDIGDTFLYIKDNLTGFRLDNNIEESTKKIIDTINVLKTNRSFFKNNCLKMNPFLPSFFIKPLKLFIDNYNH